MSLLRTTKKLLSRQKKERGSLANVLRALPGNVDRNWFYKFASGEIVDPGVTKVQALHDCLEKLVASDSANSAS
jgi:hypothetical protein